MHVCNAPTHHVRDADGIALSWRRVGSAARRGGVGVRGATCSGVQWCGDVHVASELGQPWGTKRHHIWDRSAQTAGLLKIQCRNQLLSNKQQMKKPCLHYRFLTL